MPALRHATHSGQWKALAVQLKPGEPITLPTSGAAQSFRCTARLIGMRVAVRRITRGQPEHTATLITSP